MLISMDLCCSNLGVLLAPTRNGWRSTSVKDLSKNKANHEGPVTSKISRLGPGKQIDGQLQKWGGAEGEGGHVLA